MKQECKRFLIIYIKYFIVPTYHPTFQSASYALFGKPSIQTTYTRLQNDRYISHINTNYALPSLISLILWALFNHRLQKKTNSDGTETLILNQEHSILFTGNLPSTEDLYTITHTAYWRTQISQSVMLSGFSGEFWGTAKQTAKCNR